MPRIDLVTVKYALDGIQRNQMKKKIAWKK